MKAFSLNETQFRASVGVGAALLVLIIFRMRFCYELELPEPPPAPALSGVQAEAISDRLNKSAASYAAYLRQDSQQHGINPIATPTSMAVVFVHRQEQPAVVLRPGDDAVSAAGLQLRVVAQDVSGTPMRQMLLEIENTSAEPLAYRVVTRPTKGTKPCHRKRHNGHNAVAIAPGAIEIRSECIYRSGWGIEIAQVETMELPELGYIYVSSMPPGQLGLDGRVSAGHRPPGSGATCSILHAANIQRRVETGEISWQDLVDFYARHSCKYFSFPVGYTAFKTSGQRALPVGDESY